MGTCASKVHVWISIDRTGWNVFGDLQIDLFRQSAQLEEHIRLCVGLSEPFHI